MKRNKQKTLRNKCDKLWADLTKLIHKQKHGSICLWCRKETDKLQSDHIINRWKSATRWNLSNCVVLCAPCHLFVKKREPLSWGNMVKENVPEDTLQALEDASKTIYKPDYEYIYSQLCEAKVMIEQDKWNQKIGL